MARISRDEILEACIDGIKKSFFEYQKWNDGEWLWNAPEYFLTVNIAKSLWKIKKHTKFVSLEDNVRDTLKNANSSKASKLKRRARPDGRSDIVFWWGGGTPRGIIEVKHAIYNKSHLQIDLDRIYELLKKKSDLEFGVTTFYIDTNQKKGNASDKLEERIKKEFIKNIAKETKKKGYKYRWIYEEILSDNDNQDAAYAVAIMICKTK